MKDNEEIIIKKGDCEYALTEKRIRELTSKFIEIMNEDASMHNDFGKNCKVVSTLIEIKKAWFPAITKNMVGTVDDFDKQLDKWFTLQKDMLEEKKKHEGGVYEIIPAKPRAGN